jgi:hypothetical protein
MVSIPATAPMEVPAPTKRKAIAAPGVAPWAMNARAIGSEEEMFR